MGLFGKLFKKEADKPLGKNPEAVEVKLDNLVEWIKQSNSDRISSATADLSKTWSDLQSGIEDLQTAIRALEKVKFEPGDKTYATINMTKDMFTKKSQLLAKVPKNLGQDFKDARAAYSDALEIISGIKEANAKQVYIISNYFKKEADQIIKTMKNIDNILAAFQKKMDTGGSIIFLIDEVLKEVSVYTAFAARINGIDKEESGLFMEISRLSSELNSQKAMLEKINAGKEWAEIGALEKELQRINPEITKTAYDFSESVSAIKRPVKKIIHENKALGLTKDQLNMLSSDLGIGEAGKADMVLSIIETCLSKNKTILKDPEIEKINSFKAKIKSGEFQKQKEVYDNLFAKKASLEDKYKSLAGVEKEKGKAESEIREIEQGLVKAKAEAGKLKEEREKISGEMEAQRSKIAAIVSQKLGKQVAIGG